MKAHNTSCTINSAVVLILEVLSNSMILIALTFGSAAGKYSASTGQAVLIVALLIHTW